jgi:hypothetical protein
MKISREPMTSKNQFLGLTAEKILFDKSLLKSYIRREIPWPYRIALYKPIFIIGSSRSGTSMLANLLGASPELHFFAEKPMVRRHMWRMVEEPSSISDELPQLEKTLVRLSGISRGQRLLEKTPGHSLLADSLAAYFPDAKFIHILRDGRDVASSMLKHSWIGPELLEVHKVFWFKLLPEDFQNEWQKLSAWERGILRWAVYANAARRISSCSKRYLEIEYEKLCQSPTQSIQNIINFLELNNFPDLDSQLAKIKPHSTNRWRNDGLTTKQLEFHQRVISIFNLDA